MKRTNHDRRVGVLLLFVVSLVMVAAQTNNSPHGLLTEETILSTQSTTVITTTTETPTTTNTPTTTPELTTTIITPTTTTSTPFTTPSNTQNRTLDDDYPSNDNPDFLSPKNISSIFKGTWDRERGNFYTSTKSSGEFTMSLKSSETILKEFHFVEGEVIVRDGVFVHDKFWTFILQGVYSIYTGNFYFYLKPSHLLFKKLKGDNVRFNDTGAQLAFELAMKHRDVKKLRELQQAQLQQQQQFLNNVVNMPSPTSDLPSDQELLLLQQQQLQQQANTNANLDPIHVCIFKGMFKARTIKPINWEDEDDNNIIVRDHYEEDRALFQAQMQDLMTDQPAKENSAAADERQRLVRMAMTGRIEGLNCNSTIRVNDMMTFSVETMYTKAIHYTLMINVLIMIQTCSLIYQMSFTRTQSGAARVSLLTIGQQAMIDSYLCLLHLTLAIFIGGAFNAFATTAVLYFVLFSVFEMRYLLIIWKARRPQAFANGWQTMRAELQTLYTRFYGVLIVGLFAFYQLPTLFQYFLFAIYSFWLPQIYCNITRNVKKSLHPLYVIIVSISRLSLPFYLFACPDNFLRFEPDPTLVLYLSAWIFAQVFILILQHVYGPRFMLPRLFAPSRYNYKRDIPDEALEDGECQCVICMNPVLPKNNIELQENPSIIDMGDEVIEETPKSVAPVMVTPCNHVFHGECLSKWLDYKMECPTCRKTLPEL